MGEREKDSKRSALKHGKVTCAVWKLITEIQVPGEWQPVVEVWASELTAPYREHALQMNSLAIRGVKICDYYRFSFLTRLVDLIGMVWLNCEPVQDLGERAATNNHTKPTTKKKQPIPSLPYTKEQGAHTPSPLLGRTKQPFHGLSKRTITMLGGQNQRTAPSHPTENSARSWMNAWPYPSFGIQRALKNVF